MIRHIFSLLLILILSLNDENVNAQNTKPEAKIEYERTMNFVNVASKLGYMSREEIDRMEMRGMGRRGGNAEKYDLILNEERSLYTYAAGDEENRSWRRGTYQVLRDLENEKRIDFIDYGGEDYVVEDEWNLPRWKILDQIKDVNGYICLSAETKDTVKGQVIVAWFTDKIPYRFGPEGYGGLPGAILEIEINSGDAVITATKIDLDYKSGSNIELPSKIKGKKINLKEYNTMVQKFIEDSIKARRNPFWTIRY